MTPSFPAVDDSFPTLIRPFRELVEALRAGPPLAGARGELRATDVALGGLLELFEKLLPVSDVEDVFARVRETVVRLHLALAEEDAEGAARDVAALAEDLRVLQDRLGRVIESLALSPVPAVNLILHAGRQVRDHGSWPVLVACLEGLQPAWEELASQEVVPPEVEAHGEALEALVQVVNAEDPDGLEAALESVRVTGEALLEASRRLEAPPPEPAGFLCPRCGAGVSEWDRTCPSCQARMPERLREGPQVDEDLPDYVQALFDYAEQVRAGHGGWDEFQASVAELRRRAVLCLETLDRVPLPSPGVPQDELQTWHASQEAIENGLERFFVGLDHLEAVTVVWDPQILDRGLEAVLEAVRETRQVGVHMQRLLEGRLATG